MQTKFIRNSWFKKSLLPLIVFFLNGTQFSRDSFSRSNVAGQTKGGCEKIFLGEHLVQEKHKIILPLLVTRTEITSEGQDGNENLQLQGELPGGR